jgi:hypothetical protein
MLEYFEVPGILCSSWLLQGTCDMFLPLNFRQISVLWLLDLGSK